MVKKAMLALLVVLFSIALFAPKRELYYLLESKLLQYDIVIHNETIEEEIFGLKLKHPELYFGGIKVAQIEEISLFSLLISSRLKANGLTIDESLHKWLPEKINHAILDYTLLHPKRIILSLEGSFGAADGYIALDQRVVHIDLTKEGSIEPLKPLLKKGAKGWEYETSF